MVSFENIQSSRLIHMKNAGKAVFTEENIQEALREVRRALLEADVALPVVTTFLDRVRDRAAHQYGHTAGSRGALT